jgi:hypothetical protein
VYRTFMAPFFWSPFLTALFTPPIFGFLVGPNQLDWREDGKPGGTSIRPHSPIILLRCTTSIHTEIGYWCRGAE